MPTIIVSIARYSFVYATTYQAMLFWAQDLVLGVVIEAVEVLVALVAVIVLVGVLLVLLHKLLGVEGHDAVIVRAPDTPDRLQCGWHLGFVVCSVGLAKLVLSWSMGSFSPASARFVAG
jgi:hypothetical protein